MTFEELTKIKEQKYNLVQVRRLVKEQGEELAKQIGYRKQVLICGGTGCTSSGSKKVIDALERELKRHGIEKEILVVKTGCFGLCSLGPVMIVYPEAVSYTHLDVYKRQFIC